VDQSNAGHAGALRARINDLQNEVGVGRGREKALHEVLEKEVEAAKTAAAAALEEKKRKEKIAAEELKKKKEEAHTALRDKVVYDVSQHC
jgi:ribosomal protein L12E/L44/L45/RPP1/RPP2